MPPKITASPPTSFAASPSALVETSSKLASAGEIPTQSASAAPTNSSAGSKRKASPSPLQSDWKHRKMEEARIKLTRSAQAELNLHKQVHAPIEELTIEKALALIDELAEDIEQWTTATVPSRPSDDDIDHSDLKKPPRTKQEKWNSRLQDAQIMALPDNFMFDSEKDKCFAYLVDSMPVGVLLLNGGAPPCISAFVTHPGSEGAGGALLEYAVNFLSDQAIKEKKAEFKISLRPMGDAVEAYKRMGFIPNAENKKMMILDSSTTEFKDKWCEHDGEWRLAKHADKKYIS